MTSEFCTESGCHALAVMTCDGCVEDGRSGRLCADHWNAHVFGPLNEDAWHWTDTDTETRELSERQMRYGICSEAMCQWPIAGWCVACRAKLCLDHLAEHRNLHARERLRADESDRDARDELLAHLVDDGLISAEGSEMAGEEQTIDDLRFDVEKICPDCGFTEQLHAVKLPGVSWVACPRCGGRMRVGVTQVNLAVQPSEQEGGGDGA